MSFETNPRFLRDLPAEARAGRLQLPDFQRSSVWGDEDVRMLIASIPRADDVTGFLADRKRRLAELAARAMGAPLAAPAPAEEPAGDAMEDPA